MVQAQTPFVKVKVERQALQDVRLLQTVQLEGHAWHILVALTNSLDAQVGFVTHLPWKRVSVLRQLHAPFVRVNELMHLLQLPLGAEHAAQFTGQLRHVRLVAVV